MIHPLQASPMGGFFHAAELTANHDLPRRVMCIACMYVLYVLYVHTIHTRIEEPPHGHQA